MDLNHLNDIAIEAAKSAGKVIRKHMNTDVLVEKKKAGTSEASQVVTKVDKECEAVILSLLLPTCNEFDIALLSEESEDDGSRFEKDFFWCIDPLDGTLPFINKQPGFSVSIALVAKDGIPCMGVVFDPTTDTLYHAIKGKGAYKNGIQWKIEHRNNHLTYVTDKKLRDTPRSVEIEKFLIEQTQKSGLNGIEVISGAGAVINAIRVLENGPACMLKLPKKATGGGSIWDYAATACIFHELGLPARNFEGGKLKLNRKDSTFMNHQGIFYANF